jgi:hypothetical protein
MSTRKMLLPYEKRFTLLYLFIHRQASLNVISKFEAVQMLSVLCPICSARNTTCNSDFRFLEEGEEIKDGSL